MQITCTTTQAAAKVLVVLIEAHIQLGFECSLAQPRAASPPVTFVITKDLPADVVLQLQRIADAAIVDEHA
jgi:hypothetical protein